MRWFFLDNPWIILKTKEVIRWTATTTPNYTTQHKETNSQVFQLTGNYSSINDLDEAAAVISSFIPLTGRFAQQICDSNAKPLSTAT